MSSLLTFFTFYSSVYIVEFEQVSICWRPVIWHSIYTIAERCHRSIVVFVNFEHILPSSSVSTIDFEHVFIFWFWSFYISIVFRLGSIQVPFTFRTNFHEVKYFHEVACAVPRKMPGGKSRGGNFPKGNYSEVILQGVLVRRGQ